MMIKEMMHFENDEFYHEGLPLVTEMLKLSKTIKVLELHVLSEYNFNNS